MKKAESSLDFRGINIRRLASMRRNLVKLSTKQNIIKKLIVVFLLLQIICIFSCFKVTRRISGTNISISRNFNFLHNKFLYNFEAAKHEIGNPLSSPQTMLKSRNLPICQRRKPLVDLIGDMDSPSFQELEKLYPEVEPGGFYRPKHCESRHKIAMIIPYRNRDQHLRTFLKNIIPFLERQEQEFGIYVVEQDQTGKFNRGLLMNIGYKESIKLHDWDCFVFHDVDLIPLDDRMYFNCSGPPIHLAVAIDKNGFKLPYNRYFGGAVLFTLQQFEMINGFSNMYFGWGSEDDDLLKRVDRKLHQYARYSVKIARYKMIKHVRDKGNEANPQRQRLLKFGERRLEKDGLNSLQYELLNTQNHKLFTRFYVRINETTIMKNLNIDNRLSF